MIEMKNIQISYFAIPGIANKKPYNADLILREVCAYFGTTPKKVKSKPRIMALILPRHIAIYLIRKYTIYTLTWIGSYFNRTHATVMNAIKQINNDYDTNNQVVVKAIEAITNNIRINGLGELQD
jgi:chromosomal replication initiator protein